MSVPCTKGWILHRLKETFGGSVFIKSTGKYQSVNYSLKSKEGLTKLAKAVKPFLKEFPGLKPVGMLLSGEAAKRRASGLGAARRVRKDK